MATQGPHPPITPPDGLSSITGATLEKACQELREDPGKRPESIAQLQALIDSYNHEHSSPSEESPAFPLIKKDTRFLLAFLRARKFDVEGAFQLYLSYHRHRHKHADMLQDFSARSVEHVLRKGVFEVLDQRMRDGSKVLCIVPARYNIDEVPVADIFKAILLIMDRLIEDEENQVHGFSVIDNLEGISLYHVLRVSRTDANKAIVELIQEAFPGRFKGAYLVNQPWYVSIIFSLVRPFLKQKFKERVHMYGSDFSQLHELIDPAHLPSDFGGSLPPVDGSSVLRLFSDELLEGLSDP